MKIPDFLTGHVSADAFAQSMLRTFAKKGFPQARYDAPKFAIALGTSSEPHYMFLDNLYADYCRIPRLRRGGVIEKMADLRIQGIAETKANTPSADKLIPVIKDISYTWFCRAQIQEIEKDAQHQVSGMPVGDFHQAILVLDSPTQTQQADDSTLKTLNIGFDAAMTQAVHNLRSISPDKWRTVAPGCYMGMWDDTFECSRILLPDLIYRLNLPDNPVALMPARGVLLVTSSSDLKGQLTILAGARKLLDDNSHWISAHMLELVDGKWRPYTPSDARLRAFQNGMHARMDANKYAQQKTLLEAQLTRQGRDIFVATCMALKDDNCAFSVATWSAGVETWLPKTDYIMFLKPGAGDSHDKFSVPWDTAHSHLAALITKVPDMHPVRYHVVDFPDAAMLEMLRAQQVTMGPVG